MISEHDFLDESYCDGVVAVVHERSDIAVDRRPHIPGKFLTYARAAYLDVTLDAADAESQYYGAIGDSNPKLQEAFGDLYARLRSTLQAVLGEPVGYAPEALALPGIHVFRGSAIREAGTGGAHFDMQYESLRLPRPIDPDVPPLSVTVALAMPENGTGLRVHDVTHEDFVRALRAGRASSVNELAERRTVSYHEYRRGVLVLHRGLVLHALASPGPIGPQDERITLQGHGVRCGGEWLMYW